MIESPVRKYQKQKDYQRYKLFRKMKRRRRAQMEQIKDAPMKLFRRKLGLPKFGDGKNGEQEYENSPGSVIYMTPDGAFVNNKGESVNVLKMQRYALKAVAGLSPLAINSASDDVAEYNSGKSIHINPANRGKFNALKRRTGKTTEQLTHSKNPLTRKRAIFAQNARKWHHR